MAWDWWVLGQRFVHSLRLSMLRRIKRVCPHTRECVQMYKSELQQKSEGCFFFIPKRSFLSLALWATWCMHIRSSFCLAFLALTQKHNAAIFSSLPRIKKNLWILARSFQRFIFFDAVWDCLTRISDIISPLKPRLKIWQGSFLMWPGERAERRELCLAQPVNGI